MANCSDIISLASQRLPPLVSDWLFMRKFKFLFYFVSDIKIQICKNLSFIEPKSNRAYREDKFMQVTMLIKIFQSYFYFSLRLLRDESFWLVLHHESCFLIGLKFKKMFFPGMGLKHKPPLASCCDLMRELIVDTKFSMISLMSFHPAREIGDMEPNLEYFSKKIC